VAETHGVNEQIVGGSSFTALWAASSANFIGAVIGGNFIVDELGANDWLVAGMTAATVAAIEYPLIGIAEGRFNAGNVHEGSEGINEAGDGGRFSRTVKELGSLSYIALNGASSAPKIDNSLGLPASNLRRRAHAAFYGAAVSLWVAPVPGFEHVTDKGKELFAEFVNDPVEGTIKGTITAACLYAASEVIGRVRKGVSGRRSSEEQK